MNIIEHLSKNQEQFIENCYVGLSKKVNFIQLDCSRGETDLTTIAYFEKENLNEDQAISVILLRLKMFKEEWNNFKKYTKNDIIRWSKMLEKEYKNSDYLSNITEKEFNNNYLVERLSDKRSLKFLKLNEVYIDFKKFKEINPLNEKIIQISESIFKRSEIEYYLETEKHFVVLNWFTTA
jgi:hypothetical protein